MAINRVGSMASHNALVSRMLTTQQKIYDTQVQVTTEKKSQNYEGIAMDAERLVNFENQVSSANRYIQSNATGEMRMQVMSTSITAVDQVIRDFRSALIDFGALDLSNMNAEKQRMVEDISEQAFQAMQSMESYLNVRVEGRYLFAGGKTDTRPVDMLFDSFSAFQTGYTGAGSGNDFPTTRTTQMDGVLQNADTGVVNFNTAGTLTATTAGSFNGIPIGATLTAAGSTTAGNDQVYTVTGNTGTVLTVTPVPTATEATPTSATFTRNDVYYKGDELQLEQRVDDSRTVTLGVNAAQGAFEKAIRAMGIIAQDALEGNATRVQTALNLLNDSLQHDATTNPTEDANDMMTVQRDLGRNMVIMAEATSTHTDYIGFLESRVIDMENVNLTEAVTRLNDHALALDVSMRTMARIQSLSLANYI